MFRFNFEKWPEVTVQALFFLRMCFAFFLTVQKLKKISFGLECPFVMFYY